VNFRFLASAVWTTAEAIEAIAHLKNGEFTSKEAKRNGND